MKVKQITNGNIYIFSSYPATRLTCKSIPLFPQREQVPGCSVPWQCGPWRANLSLKKKTSVSAQSKAASYKLLFCGPAAYPCQHWLWQWSQLNWHHLTWKRWCSRPQSHWRSDAIPAGIPWRVPPCCRPCELVLSNLHLEWHCRPPLEDFKKNKTQWVVWPFLLINLNHGVRQLTFPGR